MKLGILTTISVILIFLLTISGLLLRHVKPLIPLSHDVIYTETGDFLADGRAYMPIFRKRLLYLHLPQARPEHRWWTVDYRAELIDPVREPVFFLFGYMVFQKDFSSTKDRRPGYSIMQKFSNSNISFTNDSLTCIVRSKKGY